MISRMTYTDKEIDTIYSAIEESISNSSYVDMDKILSVIKQGDFYLEGKAVGGFTFEIPGLYWQKDGVTYACLIQPQITGGIYPKWKVEFTRDIDTFSSSGQKDMLKKKYRLIKHRGYTDWRDSKKEYNNPYFDFDLPRQLLDFLEQYKEEANVYNSDLYMDEIRSLSRYLDDEEQEDAVIEYFCRKRKRP